MSNQASAGADQIDDADWSGDEIADEVLLDPRFDELDGGPAWWLGFADERHLRNPDVDPDEALPF